MEFFSRVLSTFAATAASATPDPNATGAELAGAGAWLQLLIFIVPLGLMYLILIVPQRKKEKKLRQTIGSAIVGDSIVTIGGMAGKIVNIKDDEITFETSVERTKVTVKKWAVKEVVKPVQS